MYINIMSTKRVSMLNKKVQNKQMYFIIDILKMNHAGIDIYAHIFSTGDKTKNGKYNWYRLIVYDYNNNEIGIYKGIQMLSNRTGNHYYKFINENDINKFEQNSKAVNSV